MSEEAMALALPPNEPSDRFSFRQDMAIKELETLLALHPSRGIHVLDCGFRDWRLAKAMMASGLNVRRIFYRGFDVSYAAVQAAHAEQERGAFADFWGFEVKQRNLKDLAGYRSRSFHLIMLNNVLHEVPAEDIPLVLLSLNRLLARKATLSIIDMEQMPPDEFEPWAILWNGQDVERILQAGGFRPRAYRHTKSVPVYRVSTRAATDVDTPAMARAVVKILIEKRVRLVATAAAYWASRDNFHESQRAQSELAAVDVAIERLRGRVTS
jgi:ubiquinone/menaquinone biosynthesis C-methylase UbiE